MSFDKHKTVCATCGYLWRTRTTNPDKVVCPKCHPKVCHGKADTRQRVDCPCGHSWTTRSAPDTAVCPKCSGKGASPHVWVTKVADIPKSPDTPAPPPGNKWKNYDKNLHYGQTAVTEFLRGLGCHSADNYGRCMAQRTDLEYATSLRQLIWVNKTRHDSIGAMETSMAFEILKRLGQ